VLIHDSEVFRLKHPAILGTSVYLDETGVIDMSEERPEGQDVRFYSSYCWATWAQGGLENHVVECLDGCTGLVVPMDGALDSGTKLIQLSCISTRALTEAFLIAIRAKTKQAVSCPASLRELRSLKATFAGPYENAKNRFLSSHSIMREWRRRCK